MTDDKLTIKTQQRKIESDAEIIAEQQATILQQAAELEQLRGQIAQPADPVDDGVE